MHEFGLNDDYDSVTLTTTVHGCLLHVDIVNALNDHYITNGHKTTQAIPHIEEEHIENITQSSDKQDAKLTRGKRANERQAHTVGGH